MKNEVKKIESFLKGVEKLESSGMLLIKGGNKPKSQTNSQCHCNTVCDW